MRVEVQDSEGKPLADFTLADATEVYCDCVEQAVPWKDGSELAALAGQVIRLRFVLRDADLFAFRFAE